MKKKLKFVATALLLFGASGLNTAKAITADELLVVVQQFAAAVGQAFTQVVQVLTDHDTRIGDNEARVGALENADAAAEARIAALEAEPRANIATTSPTSNDDINGGFQEGTTWVDIQTQQAYILVDSAPGAAVWKKITPIYEVGQRGPGGGIVFISFSSGLEGFEAAPADVPQAQWCGTTAVNLPGADGTFIGAGEQNTADIVAGCPPGASPNAAEAAANYSLNGFDDWFLPSKDELNELFIQKDVVGGFTAADYWSSSESPSSAWLQNFGTGSQSDQFSKTNTLQVRPIRFFFSQE